MAALLSCECVKTLPVADKLSALFCAIRTLAESGPSVVNAYAFLNLTSAANVIITPAVLNAAMLGAVPGTWSYGAARQNSVNIDPATSYSQIIMRAQTEYQLVPPVVCNGQTITSVTRRIDWDKSLAIAAGDWETVRWAPGEIISGNFMVDYRYEQNRSLGADVNGTSIDLTTIYYGGDFAACQTRILANGSIDLRPHGGQAITIANGIRYHIFHLANIALGFCQLCVFNDTTGAFIGASQFTFTPSDVLTFLIAGNYLVNGDGNGYDSAITLQKDAAAKFPSFTLPALSSIAVEQTDDGELTITGFSTAISFKVERRHNGGAYSTIDANFLPIRTNASDTFVYVDAGLVNGDTYQYRITAKVNTTSSATTTSAVVTVANLVWTYSLAGGSTDTNDDFPEYPTLQPIVAGTTGTCRRLSVWIREYNSALSIKVALYDAAHNKIGEGAVTGLVSSAGANAEITLNAGVAVTNGTTYGVGFAFVNAANGKPGFLAGQPSGTSYVNFASSYAAFPNNPFVVAGNGVTWLLSVGMGVAPA